MDKKIHFKMYKSGKQWFVAGLAAFAIAAPSVAVITHAGINSATVSAAETADATDHDAPILSTDDLTLDVGSVFTAKSYIQAYDDVDGDVSGNVEITSNDVDTSKPGTYHVAYQVPDKAGNIAKGTMTVTVTDPNAADTTGPEINAFDHDVLVGSVWNPLDGVSAYDEKDGDIDASSIKVSGDKVDTSKKGSYHVTYTVSDKAGNQTTKSIVITVKDKSETSGSAPTLVTSDVTLQKGDTWDALKYANAYGKQATDVVAVTADGDVDTSKPGTYQVTYTANNQNNESVSKTITVTVLDTEKDTVAPVISNADDINLNVGDSYDPASQGVTAYDTRDGSVDVKAQSSDVNTSKAGTYHVVYQATDAAGNTSTKTITITVAGSSDHTVPTITADNVTIDKDSSFDPLKNVSATDNIDGKTDVIVESNDIDTSKPGTYTVVYSATDKSGNKSTKSITVKVVDPTSKDTVKPVITADDVTISDNSAFEPLKNASATDDTDGTIPVKVISTDVDVNTKGTYHVTYQASDTAGNIASKTITVTVTKSKDTVAPNIKASDVTLEKDASFDPLAAASATDNADGDVKVKVVDSDVDTSKVGTYHVTYSATDKAGNKSTAEITVKVVSKITDKTGPVLKVQDVTVTQGRDFDPLFVTKATDDVDGLVQAYLVKSDYDSSKIGTYHITVGAKDSSGNETTKTFMVTVVKSQNDTEAPHISYNEPHLKTGDKFDYTKYIKVTDNVDEKPFVDVNTDNINMSKAGTYLVYVLTSDAAGNISSTTFNVRVSDDYKDTTAPVITTQDTTLNLNDKFDPKSDISVVDDHDGYVSYEITKNDVDTAKKGTYHVTYKATDVAGNVATKTIRVEVVDENDNSGHNEGDNSSSSNSSSGSNSSNGNSSNSTGSQSSSNDTSNGNSSSKNDDASDNTTDISSATGTVKTIANDPAVVSDDTSGNTGLTTSGSGSSSDDSNTPVVSNDSAPASDDAKADASSTAGSNNSSTGSDNKANSSLPDSAATPSNYTGVKAILIAIATVLSIGVGSVFAKLKKR